MRAFQSFPSIVKTVPYSLANRRLTLSTEIDLPFLKKLRIVGVIEGISTLILFGIAMPLKYLAGKPMAVTIAGSIHGCLFVLLVVMFFLAMDRVPISTKLATAGVVGAIFPFGPFVVDVWLGRLVNK